MEKLWGPDLPARDGSGTIASKETAASSGTTVSNGATVSSESLKSDLRQDNDPKQPNLLDMILELNSECGLDAFMGNLVSVLETSFGAERITVSLPSDPSDVINIPWGLKATWKKSAGVYESFSLNKNSRQSDTMHDTDVPARPGVERSWSFRNRLFSSRRFSKSKGDSQDSLHVNDINVYDNAYDDVLSDDEPSDACINIYGQAKSLNTEGDPLIDTKGVLKALELNKLVILLRRQYKCDTSETFVSEPMDSGPFNPENGTFSLIHLLIVSPDPHKRNEAVYRDSLPIAIISFLSTLVPFPPKLKTLLEQLTPHIATSFQQVRAYSNLLHQVSLSSNVHRRSIQRHSQFHFPTEMEQIPITLDKPSSSGHHRQSGPRKSRVRPRIKNLLTRRTAGTSEKGTTSSKTEPIGAKSDPLTKPSNKLLRTIIDALPINVYIAEPINGDIVWVSNRSLVYLGVSAEDFCNHPFDHIHQEDRARFVDMFYGSLRTGNPLATMLRVRRFDGKYRNIFYRSAPLRDHSGAITSWFCTVVDIHKQRKSEMDAMQLAQETASDQKYQILAESAPIIVFATRPKEGIIYANSKWYDYSGLDSEGTNGFNYVNTIHPDDQSLCILPTEFGGPLSQDKSYKEGSFAHEVRIKHKNGDYRWHLVLFTCSSPDDPDNALWFGTATDINDQKLIQENLREAKDAAQRTIESKSRFLSNMSHEIRTPLVGISGVVGFLLDTNLDAEQLDYCHTISSSSDALLMVINDILDISKVESGKMTLTYSWFYVRRLVEEVNELLSSMAISKNLELNYIVSDDVPQWIKGDRVRLRQVLLNLIGNAIKFTDKGEIYTYASVKSESIGDKMTLLFEVHDTGRGFTSDDARKMFRPYFQGQTGQHSSVASGTGLGLVISKQLIELHKGKLTCDGEKGKGSTFWFTCEVKLPTEDDRPSEKQMVKDKSGPKSPLISSSLRILVACPWKFTAASIEHHIKVTVDDPDKCEIVTVDEFQKVQDIIGTSNRTDWTHVVVNTSDIEEASVLLLYLGEKLPKSSATKLIVLTSPAQRTALTEKLDQQLLSRITFLAKPLKPSRYSVVFDPSKVREESQDIKMQSAQKSVESHRSVFKELSSFTQGKDYRVLLAEDNLVNQKVIAQFLSKAGISCTLATDGVDCISKLLINTSKHEFDIVLCDLDMPRKDGFQACIEIRQWEKEHSVPPIPIIALSAYVMSDVSERCVKVGFSQYISKPVNFGVLKDALITQLSNE